MKRNNSSMNMKHFVSIITMFVFAMMFTGGIILAADNHVTTDLRGGAKTSSANKITEEDEKAIQKLISTYTRFRNNDVNQLEMQINNYFITQYGSARSFYVVEFRTAGNGTLKDRTVYVLMGDNDVKYLDDAVGGFLVPTLVPKSGYAFDYWNINGESDEILSQELGSLPITGATVIYANFSIDNNRDGVPDRKQQQYTVEFVSDQGFGTLEGKVKFTVYAGIGQEYADLKSNPDFTSPQPISNDGYAFDKWMNQSEEIENLYAYQVNRNTTIKAIFAADVNNDKIPDYKQRTHQVFFTAGMGGTIQGDTEQREFTVVMNSDDNVPTYAGDSYFNIYPYQAVPDDDYMFLHWVDHMGNVITDEDFTKYLLYCYPITSDTVFVAIFAEDKNHDNIPDDRQEFFQVDFVCGVGGTIEGTTSMVYATYGPDKYPALGERIKDVKVVADTGYIFDYWVNHRGELHEPNSDWYKYYEVDEDTVFVALFADDRDENGIADYMQEISSIPSGRYTANGILTFNMDGCMNDLQGDFTVQDGILEATEDTLKLTFHNPELGEFTIQMDVFTYKEPIFFSKLVCNGVEYKMKNDFCPFQFRDGVINSSKISEGGFYINFGLEFDKISE